MNKSIVSSGHPRANINHTAETYFSKRSLPEDKNIAKDTLKQELKINDDNILFSPSAYPIISEYILVTNYFKRFSIENSRHNIYTNNNKELLEWLTQNSPTVLSLIRNYVESDKKEDVIINLGFALHPDGGIMPQITRVKDVSYFFSCLNKACANHPDLSLSELLTRVSESDSRAFVDAEYIGIPRGYFYIAEKLINDYDFECETIHDLAFALYQITPFLNIYETNRDLFYKALSVREQFNDHDINEFYRDGQVNSYSVFKMLSEATSRRDLLIEGLMPKLKDIVFHEGVANLLYFNMQLNVNRVLSPHNMFFSVEGASEKADKAREAVDLARLINLGYIDQYNQRLDQKLGYDKIWEDVPLEPVEFVKEEEKPVHIAERVYETTKSDLSEAAKRTFVAQTFKVIREPLIAILSERISNNQKESKNATKFLVELFSSKYGEILMFSLVGALLENITIPGIKEDSLSQFATEARIQGYTKGGMMLTDLVSDSLVNTLKTMLSSHEVKVIEEHPDMELNSHEESVEYVNEMVMNVKSA